MNDEWVWLVGGGVQQVPMAEEIKRRGFKLLLTDLNHLCECRQYADLFAGEDIYNVRAQMSVAERIEFRPEAVLTVGTDAGVEVATLAHYFDLPRIPVAIAKAARQKTKMRQLTDLDYPDYMVVDLDAIGDSLDEWHLWPAVVKADDSSGSKGLCFVDNTSELQKAILTSGLASRTKSRKVLIEEYLPGVDVLPELDDFDTSEAAIEFLVEDGQVHFANGALRLFWRNRPGIEAGHFNPFVPDAGVMAMAQVVAERLGLTWGPFKMDIKQFIKNGWVTWALLETATRLSGGFDHMFTCPLATGKDITGAMLDMALGYVLDKDKLRPKKNGVACCLSPYFKPGKITGWKGADKDNFFIRATEEIKPLADCGARPLFAIREGSDWREALRNTREALYRVSPVYSRENE